MSWLQYTMHTIYNAMATMHNEVVTMNNEVPTMHNELATMGNTMHNEDHMQSTMMTMCYNENGYLMNIIQYSC